MKQPNDLYVETVLRTDYIKDNEIAKKVVNTLFSTLVSSLSEEGIYYFSNQFPHLGYHNMMDCKQNNAPTSPDDCINLIRNHSGISDKQAEEIMIKLISVIEAESKGKSYDMAKYLTTEWHNLIKMLNNDLITLISTRIDDIYLMDERLRTVNNFEKG